ncbi:alpha/beta fold hydrolase [Rhodoferax sp.]|uniref:alpha/beta hydrolase n=1 Tax=Rhodoferax sp. TaxID=50421 RepID=UPI00260B8902|nr:alpha/beta fold hydrolase [Rhodoferax sp.]
MLALAGCAWVSEQQRQLIYRPTRSVSPDSAPLPTAWQHYQLALPDTRPPEHVALWWRPSDNATAPTLLYLHGTFRNLDGNLRKINALHAAGFNVLAVDYRGWGQSSAITPSEQTIMADARLAWAELVRREPRPERRVIYGHSMGSGVAVALASTLAYPQDYGGLVLESAFTSFTDVARSAGFWASVLNLFNTERFASIDKISQVHAPLLMLHGTQDHTIPIALGAQLFAAANAPKRWLAIESASHSDLDVIAPQAYQQALHDLMNSTQCAVAFRSGRSKPSKPTLESAAASCGADTK